MADDFRYQSGPTWNILEEDLQGLQSEHNLFESFVVEANDIFGLPVEIYLHEFNVSHADVIYGEDQNEYYRGPFLTKLTHHPTEEPSLVNMFGISSSEMIENASIPKFTFSRDVSASAQPKVGDLIHFIYNDIWYQISDIDEEVDIFHSKKFSYDFTVRPYKMTNVETSAAIDPMTDGYPLSAWGDNVKIEEESNKVHDYADLPTFESIYGVGDN